MNITRKAVELNSMFNAKAGKSGEYLTARVLGSFTLALDPEDKSLTPHLTTEGFWESWITTWFVNNMDDYTLFVDIGSNTGYYAFLAAVRGLRVVAYEPNPKYVRLLNKSRELNKDLRVNVRPFAVADKPGKLTLSVPGDFHGSASVVHDFADFGEPVESVTVDVTTLDTEPYFSGWEKSPYLLKIDAESAEEMVWDGATELLHSDRPGTVVMEYTPGAYSNKFFDKMLDFGDLSFIDHAGEERPITTDWLDDKIDWTMLVIRKR